MEIIAEAKSPEKRKGRPQAALKNLAISLPLNANLNWQEYDGIEKTVITTE